MIFFGSNSVAQEILLPDQTFTVKVLQKTPGEVPKNLPAEEVVIYGNAISSTFSKKDGFLVASIVNQNEDKMNLSSVTFTAACTNDKHCALRWSCTVIGNQIEGKAQKFFTGKLVSEYTFSGTRNKKK